MSTRRTRGPADEEHRGPNDAGRGPRPVSVIAALAAVVAVLGLGGAIVLPRLIEPAPDGISAQAPPTTRASAVASPDAEPAESPSAPSQAESAMTVPPAFDAEGQPLGTTPESPAAVAPRPGAGPPDPLTKSPHERSDQMVMPDGLEQDPSWRPAGWDDRDGTGRGWGPSHLSSLRIATPGQDADGEAIPPMTVEFMVTYVGDESDVRDATNADPRDPGAEMSMVDVDGHEAVLTVLADGGDMRIDMAVNGELITALATSVAFDGVRYGPTPEQLVALMGSYLDTLYDEA